MYEVTEFFLCFVLILSKHIFIELRYITIDFQSELDKFEKLLNGFGFKK